jgi:hypothetical protein
MIRGKCTVHEIDLAAYSPSHSFVAEAKFHARPGIKSDLQVALYSYARFLDLNSARICAEDTCGIIALRVITNTKFTEAAIKYAGCVGIELLSWDQPRGESLHAKIEKYGVYPITVLTHLGSSQKQLLLQNGVILCTEIARKPHMLERYGVRGIKFDNVIKEINALVAKGLEKNAPILTEKVAKTASF